MNLNNYLCSLSTKYKSQKHKKIQVVHLNFRILPISQFINWRLCLEIPLHTLTRQSLLWNSIPQINPSISRVAFQENTKNTRNVLRNVSICHFLFVSRVFMECFLASAVLSCKNIREDKNAGFWQLWTGKAEDLPDVWPSIACYSAWTASSTHCTWLKDQK